MVRGASIAIVVLISTLLVYISHAQYVTSPLPRSANFANYTTGSTNEPCETTYTPIPYENMVNITAGNTLLVQWNTGGVNTGTVEIRLLPAELSDSITNWNNDTLCKSFLSNSASPFIGAGYGAAKIQLIFNKNLYPGPYTVQWKWKNGATNLGYNCADLFVVNPKFSAAPSLSFVSAVVVLLTISFFLL